MIPQGTQMPQADKEGQKHLFGRGGKEDFRIKVKLIGESLARKENFEETKQGVVYE